MSNGLRLTAAIILLAISGTCTVLGGFWGFALGNDFCTPLFGIY